ncbi:MAG: succinylglutamate desuccinylase/aspartoacylase family protein [Chloroflexi bacterium]|nr:succinylglutamate desuccinylase/aspartoacylase family protein [Chloroflexota bacterium]
MEFRVRDLAAAPGQKVSGWLKVFENWNGPFNLPLIILNGAHPGKRLLVLAMQHGDEYAGFAAAHQVARMVDPAELSGTLVMIPCMNVPAFVAAQRWSSLEGLNMNRVWPGRKDGEFSEQVVNVIAEEILPQVDYAIDLHGGTIELEIISYVSWCDTESESALPLALAAGIELITGNGKHPANFFSGTAARRGKPTLIVECGGGARMNEAGVKDHVKAVTNTMKHLKMLPGQLEGLPATYKFIDGVGPGFVRSHAGGFLRTRIKLGDWVKAGQTLGVIVNLLGEVVEEIKAPEDCLVREVRSMPRVEPGGWLYLLGKVRKEEPVAELVSAGKVGVV